MFANTTLLNIPFLHIHHSAATHDGGFWHALPSILGDVVVNTVEITVLVLLMMALIELVNVSSSGRWMAKLQHKPFLQLVVCCLLGIIPGCAGGFAVVSLYTHDLLSFGALLGGMVATFGDEAFFLFAQSPKWGGIVTGILFSLGIIVGLAANGLVRERRYFIHNPKSKGSHGFEIHDNIDITEQEHPHEHEDVRNHTTSPRGFKARVGHFFVEHLWNHVVRQHFLTVFLWSFGVLLFLKTFGYFLDIDSLLHTHIWAKYVLLLVAVLVGLIPESGPHLVFIVMFLDGSIPFGVLLANCIAQNGHAGLPLLAQSRRDFLLMKSVTAIVGLACGALLI